MSQSVSVCITVTFTVSLIISFSRDASWSGKCPRQNFWKVTFLLLNRQCRLAKWYDMKYFWHNIGTTENVILLKFYMCTLEWDSSTLIQWPALLGHWDNQVTSQFTEGASFFHWGQLTKLGHCYSLLTFTVMRERCGWHQYITTFHYNKALFYSVCQSLTEEQHPPQI